MPPALPRAQQQVLRGHGTVLFVDDEDLVRQTGATLLAGLGYEVLQASSGHEALECVRAHHGRIDLIILDCTMPGMNGEQCFRALRCLAPELPVLLSSGHGSNAAIDSLLAAGAEGFLRKPYSAGELSAAIESARARTGSHESASHAELIG